MWRSKKFIVLATLAALILVGVISAGAVYAASNGEETQPETQMDEFWDKISQSYFDQTGHTLDREALQEAFADARSEIMNDRLQNHLQNLVTEGKITQEEADQYLSWWSDKPDVPLGIGLGDRGRFGRCFRIRIGPCTPAE